MNTDGNRTIWSCSIHWNNIIRKHNSTDMEKLGNYLLFKKFMMPIALQLLFLVESEECCTQLLVIYKR